MTQVDLHSFPRCASYLGAVDERALNAPEVTPYWAAVIIADAMPTSQLEASGFVWPDGSRDADAILAGLEKALAGKRGKNDISGADFSSLKAFIGSRGVKVRRLKTGDDFMLAVNTLWLLSGSECTSLSEAHKAIKSMTKRERSYCDVDALRRLKPEWFQ